MLVFTLFACGAQSAPPTNQAGLVLFDGEAHVSRDSHLLPAAVGLALRRTDILLTGEDGMMVIALPNHHLVRIDAALELPVNDLVLWNAKPTDRSPEDQLSVLLYPDEQARLSANDRERIAGWHGRATTAQAPAALEEATAVDDEAAEDFAPPPAAERAQAEPTPSKKVAPPAAKRPSPRPASRTRKLQPSILPPPKAGFGAGGASTPQEVAPLLDPTSSCMVEWFASLGLPHQELTLHLQVSDGTIVRAVIEGGLTIPPCARASLLGKELPVGQPITFTLDL